MERLFSELRERILRAGVAPRHVRRYLRELADHLADLTAEEERAGRSPTDAHFAALRRLGEMGDLAKAMIDQCQFQSWSAQSTVGRRSVSRPVIPLWLPYWPAALFHFVVRLEEFFCLESTLPSAPQRNGFRESLSFNSAERCILRRADLHRLGRRSPSPRVSSVSPAGPFPGRHPHCVTRRHGPGSRRPRGPRATTRPCQPALRLPALPLQPLSVGLYHTLLVFLLMLVIMLQKPCIIWGLAPEVYSPS